MASFGGDRFDSTGDLPPTYRGADGGNTASQAKYQAELEREAREGKRNILVRALVAIRRAIWGS